MTFTEFCDQISYVTEEDKKKVSATDTKPDNVDDSLLDLFINNMKKVKSKFDVFELSYIQKKFENIERAVEHGIKDKYPDGNIPDYIINRISKGLYETDYMNLSDDKCRIINVLSIYYTI